MANLRVGTRELKSKWSAYMRRVKGGETIIVTERGKAIGQIIPIRATIEEKMQAVVDAGLAEWNGKKFRPELPAALNTGIQQVSELVVENRDVDYLF
jgi:prevent-host-death family protein